VSVELPSVKWFHQNSAPCGVTVALKRVNKKTPPITEVMRRGRNREEASSLLWGDKEDQAIANTQQTNNLAVGLLNKLADQLLLVHP